ncbi:hypothetical protein BDR04DRAFT_689466 [Suillus decipiens]|nr:hypothetical protein BDR04DRAFT_689466 [Suillus decipiens]
MDVIELYDNTERPSDYTPGTPMYSDIPESLTATLFPPSDLPISAFIELTHLVPWNSSLILLATLTLSLQLQRQLLVSSHHRQILTTIHSHQKSLVRFVQSSTLDSVKPCLRVQLMLPSLLSICTLVMSIANYFKRT